MRVPSAPPLLSLARRHPKGAAAVVALLVALPIAATGGRLVGLGGAAQPPAVEFGASTLRAGEVNALKVAFRDPQATVELPRGFFPVVRGEVVPRATVSEEDLDEGKLHVLVPPVNGSFEFAAVSLKGRWTHTFTVEPGSSPVVSGADAVGNLEEITQAYQFRSSGSPKLLAAANSFFARFEGLGLDAHLYFYPWEVAKRPVLFDRAINILVVCGFQKGAVEAGEWIVLGAHMDTVPQAVEGAYDDGSGTSALLEVAQGLSQFKTRHTIVYCLWGGEEEGLYGSRAWVASEVHPRIRLYVNMDMAGLSWPAPYNFTAFVGPDKDAQNAEHPALVSALENLTEGELRYPREGNFSILEDPFGRSDHVSFWSTGAPTVFFFGADDIDYAEYHSRDDTLATMIAHAGSREVLVAGFDVLVWEALYLAVHADHEDLA